MAGYSISGRFGGDGWIDLYLGKMPLGTSNFQQIVSYTFTSAPIFNDSEYVFSATIRFGSTFICNWYLGTAHNETGSGWFYYTDPPPLNWDTNFTVDGAAPVIIQEPPSNFSYPYPGKWIWGNITGNKIYLKTLIRLRTRQPTMAPIPKPTPVPTLKPTPTPTRSPIQGEIVAYVVITFSISCNYSCVSDLLDTSVQITDDYLTKKNISLKGNTLFDTFPENASISIGVSDEDMGIAIDSYCNQNEYKERIADGTNSRATVDSVTYVPNNTNHAKKNASLAAIIGGSLGVFILLILGIVYYFWYWRPKKIYAKKKEPPQVERLTSISNLSRQKSSKKSTPVTPSTSS